MPLKGQLNSLWAVARVGGRRFGGLLLSAILSNDQQPHVCHASFSTDRRCLRDARLRSQDRWRKSGNAAGSSVAGRKSRVGIRTR